MEDELVFHTHPMSRGRIARWMLEEVGQPCRTELLDFGTSVKAPAYLARAERAPGLNTWNFEPQARWNLSVSLGGA